MRVDTLKPEKQTRQTPKATVTHWQQKPFSAWLSLTRCNYCTSPSKLICLTWLTAWHLLTHGQCPVLTCFDAPHPLSILSALRDNKDIFIYLCWTFWKTGSKETLWEKAPRQISLVSLRKQPERLKFQQSSQFLSVFQHFRAERGRRGTGHKRWFSSHTGTDGEHNTLQAVGLLILWQKHIKAWKRGIAQGVNIKGKFKDEGLGKCHPAAVDSTTNRKVNITFWVCLLVSWEAKGMQKTEHENVRQGTC